MKVTKEGALEICFEGFVETARTSLLISNASTYAVYSFCIGLVSPEKKKEIIYIIKSQLWWQKTENPNLTCWDLTLQMSGGTISGFMWTPQFELLYKIWLIKVQSEIQNLSYRDKTEVKGHHPIQFSICLYIIIIKSLVLNQVQNTIKKII